MSQLLNPNRPNRSPHQNRNVSLPLQKRNHRHQSQHKPFSQLLPLLQLQHQPKYPHPRLYPSIPPSLPPRPKPSRTHRPPPSFNKPFLSKCNSRTSRSNPTLFPPRSLNRRSPPKTPPPPSHPPSSHSPRNPKRFRSHPLPITTNPRPPMFLPSRV